MADGRNELWLVDLVQAFRELEEEPGGVVWLQNLYDWSVVHRPQRPKDFAAVIRATIYCHSTDSEKYVPGNPDVFRKIGHGGWGLRLPKEAVPSRSTHLRSFIIMRMSTEELQALASKEGGALQEIDRQVDALRRKFNMRTD